MEYFASAVHLCGYASYTGLSKPTHSPAHLSSATIRIIKSLLLDLSDFNFFVEFKQYICECNRNGGLVFKVTLCVLMLRCVGKIGEKYV
jgi:hypothetical protein